jgi:hypothetical protein
MITTPKSQSVTEQGEPDGWTPTAGFVRDVGRQGETQVIVSAPAEQLAAVHRALVAALEGPLSVLYRQVVDRRSPRPQGAPPKDWVAVGLAPAKVLEVLEGSAGVVYHDARCELWVRGRLGDQVVLDADGLIYCQPDDPVFEDALRAAGLAEGVEQTILDRDYARHWFHAEHDAQEDALRASLGMTEVSARAPR